MMTGITLPQYTCLKACEKIIMAEAVSQDLETEREKKAGKSQDAEKGRPDVSRFSV